MFVEREPRIMFVSMMYSCKLSHRQNEMKMEVQISAILGSFKSLGMPNLIYSFLNSQASFRRQASPPTMQLLSKELLPPSESPSFHFPPESHPFLNTDFL